MQLFLQLTEEEQELLYPILINLQEDEINKPNIDVDKLETIEKLIEKLDRKDDGEFIRGTSVNIPAGAVASVILSSINWNWGIT